MSGDSQLVTDTATTPATANSRHGRTSSQSATGKSSSGSKQSGTAAATKPVAAGRPGAWLTAALTSGGGGGGLEATTNSGEETEEDDHRRSHVETVSVGVQWEEEVGDAAGALPPSSSSMSMSMPSSTRGGLPPWAKPYARLACPPTKGAVGDDNSGSGSDTSVVVAVESSGIQCGESMLGG